MAKTARDILSQELVAEVDYVDLNVWGVRMRDGDYWLKNAAGEVILFTREQAFDVAYGLTVQGADEGSTWYACEASPSRSME